VGAESIDAEDSLHRQAQPPKRCEATQLGTREVTHQLSPPFTFVEHKKLKIPMKTG